MNNEEKCPMEVDIPDSIISEYLENHPKVLKEIMHMWLERNGMTKYIDVDVDDDVDND